MSKRKKPLMGLRFGVVAVSEMKTLDLPTLQGDFICKVMARMNGRNWGL
ncbi:hypothetical protein [Klebsiella pneumoniae]|nr:hypothetical protein [Klebsiella quasipneumoniae subsp. quasipneumoniae]